MPGTVTLVTEVPACVNNSDDCIMDWITVHSNTSHITAGVPGDGEHCLQTAIFSSRRNLQNNGTTMHIIIEFVPNQYSSCSGDKDHQCCSCR